MECEIVDRLLELYIELTYFNRAKVVRDGNYQENLKQIFLSRATNLYNDYDAELSIINS